jgi:hypothetical protein
MRSLICPWSASSLSHNDDEIASRKARFIAHRTSKTKSREGRERTDFHNQFVLSEERCGCSIQSLHPPFHHRSTKSICSAFEVLCNLQLCQIDDDSGKTYRKCEEVISQYQGENHRSDATILGKINFFSVKWHNSNPRIP